MPGTLKPQGEEWHLWEMGNREGSEEAPDLTGPNVVLMKTKYGEEAVEPWNVWVKDFSFPKFPKIS